MKTALRLMLITALCIGYFASTQTPTAQAAGGVTLTSDKSTVAGGERFTVSVNVDATPGLFGAQLSLAYDNTKLKVIEVKAGSVWPQGDTFVARSSATNGGTATERIEFAATLINSALTVPAGPMVSVEFEALSPVESTTTVISNGPTWPLLLATIDGMSIPVTAPADLVLTVTPPPPAEFLGEVSLQAAAEGRLITVEVAYEAENVRTQVTSGTPFSFEVPAANAYTLTLSAPCHAAKQVTYGRAPVANFNLTLAAGDVNGDQHINIQDIAAVANLYGRTGVSGCADLAGEAGTVDLFDLSLVAGNFGS